MNRLDKAILKAKNDEAYHRRMCEYKREKIKILEKAKQKEIDQALCMRQDEKAQASG